MHYGNIKNCDVADGEGVRVTLFVSGCTNRCEHCFQPETWDFCYGEEFTREVEDKIIAMLAPSYINGLTLLGGEPFEPQNQAALLPFVREVKRRYPDKPIWCYTGFVLDEKNGVLKEQFKNTADTKELISLIDVLVDGPYVDELRNICLKFRGSSNQRVINVPKTLQRKECVLYME